MKTSMRNVVRSAATGAVVLCLALTTDAPAGAAKGHEAFNKGDAPAALDITGLWVDNGQSRVSVRVKAKDLSRRGEFFVNWQRGYDGLTLGVSNKRGKTKVLVYHSTEDTRSKVRCTGVKANWDTRSGIVSASAPQSCYPGNVPDRWTFNAWSNIGDSWDYSDYRDDLTIRRG